MPRMTDAERRQLNSDSSYAVAWASQQQRCHQVFKDLSFGKISRERAAAILHDIANNLVRLHPKINQLQLTETEDGSMANDANNRV